MMQNDRIKLLEEGIGKDNVKIIVEMTINSLYELQSNLQIALDSKIHEDIRRTAHKFKGSMQILGLDSYADLFFEIETHAKNGHDISILINLFEKINIDQIKQTLQTYLN